MDTTEKLFLFLHLFRQNILTKLSTRIIIFLTIFGREKRGSFTSPLAVHTVRYKTPRLTLTAVSLETLQIKLSNSETRCRCEKYRKE